MGRWDGALRCYDWIRIDDGPCSKMITRDCDNNDPCGWVDEGWICGEGGNILPGTIWLPTTYDQAGNLLCTVSLGTGGVYTPGNGGVCFVMNGSGTILISSALLRRNN